MIQKTKCLKVKITLGSITLIVGLIGATIALFQWVERTGVQHLFGDYTRYILGFGGFAAMILGAMLINDAYVLRNILRDKYVTSNPTSSLSHDAMAVPKRKKRKTRGKNE